MKRQICVTLLCLPQHCVSFFIDSPTPWSWPRARPCFLSSSADDSTRSNGNGEEGLILNELDQEMNKVALKNSFSEIDVLAAAKKRAQERPESRNSSAGDKDWKELAEEKKGQFGEIDDWENSMKEAGNVDSQILMFTEPESGEGDEDEGPKLLLF